MARKRYVNIKELNNPGSIKLILNEKDRFETEIKVLKKSLKLTQNAHEDTKEIKISLEKDNLLLKEKLKVNIIPEVIKIALSIGLGYLTNVLTEEYSLIKLSGLILLALIYVCIIIYQHFRNS